MRTPEEILGIPAASGVADIRNAYRSLARRWHPDRFAPGPERAWASDHMAEINGAYQALMKKARSKTAADGDILARARRLIDDGRLSTARELLMSIPTRCAEWNYLFGALNMKLSDYRRAAIYLSVAAHQKPDSEKYAKALDLARRYASRRRIFSR
jgi:molecular chaperone DnaJ